MKVKRGDYFQYVGANCHIEIERVSKKKNELEYTDFEGYLWTVNLADFLADIERKFVRRISR